MNIALWYIILETTEESRNGATKQVWGFAMGSSSFRDLHVLGAAAESLSCKINKKRKRKERKKRAQALQKTLQSIGDFAATYRAHCPVCAFRNTSLNNSVASQDGG